MEIYVGNLPFKLTEDELQKALEPYANIAAVKIIKDRITGRSKGYGFITLEKSEQGERIMEELDGIEISGRKIRLNQAVRKARQPIGNV